MNKKKSLVDKIEDWNNENGIQGPKGEEGPKAVDPGNGIPCNEIPLGEPQPGVEFTFQAGNKWPDVKTGNFAPPGKEEQSFKVTIDSDSWMWGTGKDVVYVEPLDPYEQAEEELYKKAKEEKLKLQGEPLWHHPGFPKPMTEKELEAEGIKIHKQGIVEDAPPVEEKEAVVLYKYPGTGQALTEQQLIMHYGVKLSEKEKLMYLWHPAKFAAEKPAVAKKAAAVKKPNPAKANYGTPDPFYDPYAVGYFTTGGRRSAQSLSPTPVEHKPNQEEVIINATELADHYAQNELQKIHPGCKLEDHEELYRDLLKMHLDIINTFKRTNNE